VPKARAGFRWDVQAELRALRRAARIARRHAEETGTPFYVWKDGRVVDLLATANAARKRGTRRRQGAAVAVVDASKRSARRTASSQRKR
jgi:hypothetical protein